MAEKRSKIGRDVNTIRETLKQKKITDAMSDVEAEKLFKPITSGLKELTQPQPFKRRLQRKKADGEILSLHVRSIPFVHRQLSIHELVIE